MSTLRLFVVGVVEEFDHVKDLLSGAELLDTSAQRLQAMQRVSLDSGWLFNLGAPR